MANSKGNADGLMTVSYKSASGIDITLDKQTVINYCARGNAQITEQEVAFFIRTCQAKKLDPLEEGEVYLIKYDSSRPAQIVVGKHAYNRRADRNPEYRGKKSGVVVFRDNEIIKKEGCAVYDEIGEKLIGGWCRVFRCRTGTEHTEEIYREVSFKEYNLGQSNWKSKPGTMIEKVAVAQCLREAFPNDYEGLYSEDELVASGAIAATYEVVDESTGELREVPDVEMADKEQKQQFLNKISEKFNDSDTKNECYQKVLDAIGLRSMNKMTVWEWHKAMELVDTVEIKEPENTEAEQTETVQGEPESEDTQKG